MTYPLTTSRLSIAPLGADDAAGFVAYRQDADVARWQGGEPTYSDVEAARLIAFQPSADLHITTGDDLDSRVMWMSVLHDIDTATALAGHREGILL